MLEVEVTDDVPLPVGEVEAVALALIVDDDVIVGVMVALNDTDGVLLAEPPTDKELVGVAEIVEERLIVVELLSLPLGVCVGVCDDVLVPLPVHEPVPLTDELIVDVGESLPLSEPDKEGPAPFVTLAVGECEIDLDKLIVVVGVVLDVDVPVAVPLPVDVPLALIVDDIEIESVPLKLDPREGDDDGVFDMLAEMLIVPDDVARGVGESEPLVLLDGEVEGVGTALDVILALPPNEIVEGGVAERDDVIL